MRLYLNQLEGQLAKGLAPVYLISGDEPLQCGEAADAIRARARAATYSERIVLEHGASFDWNLLLAEADNLSLFADKRIIELRLSTSKIGTEGSGALSAYLTRPPEDTLLLITSPKLDSSEQNSKWVKAITAKGVWVPAWPIEGPRLVNWIRQRLTAKGLQADAEVPPMLAEHIEGNLLAAVQEIDKLSLLFGQGTLGIEQVRASVADSSRFDPFQLVDAALQGNARRGLHILHGLQAEGTAPAVVLWALSREIRQLAQLSHGVSKGKRLEALMAAERIYDKHQPLVRKALERHRHAGWLQLLHRCALTDRAIKGQAVGDPWRLLQEAVAAMAGALPLPQLP